MLNLTVFDDWTHAPAKVLEDERTGRRISLGQAKQILAKFEKSEQAHTRLRVDLTAATAAPKTATPYQPRKCKTTRRPALALPDAACGVWRGLF